MEQRDLFQEENHRAKSPRLGDALNVWMRDRKITKHSDSPWELVLLRYIDLDYRVFDFFTFVCDKLSNSWIEYWLHFVHLQSCNLDQAPQLGPMTEQKGFKITSEQNLYHQSVPGASVRNSTRGKGHEEGGSAYAKAGSSLRRPPVPEHLPPKPESAYFTASCSHLHLWLYRGAVPHHLSQRRS